MINKKKSKFFTIVLSLCMIVAISISTVAFAEGNGQNSRETYYRTHYISTDVLIKDVYDGAPSRFFIQPNMPIELTFSLPYSDTTGIKIATDVSIKGYSSSARNYVENGNTFVEYYGDEYVDNRALSEFRTYSTNSNGLSTVLYNQLSTGDTGYIYKTIYGSPLNDNYEHSVFTQGYAIIRGTIPLFRDGTLTEHSITGLTNYYSQYTHFSEEPTLNYSMFTVGNVPLDLSAEIYYKECYFYGYNNNYTKYYLCSGNQVSAFRVFCWSNNAFELSDDTLYEGVYLILPSSIPPVCVEYDGYTVGENKSSIHLSYVSALGSQLDKISTTKYNQGYQDGAVIGYNNGRYDGYQEGLAKTDVYSFDNLITSVLDAPIKVLLGIFSQKEVALDSNGEPLLDSNGDVVYIDKDLEILGLNLHTFVRSILLIVLFIFVIKVVLSLFNINTSSVAVGPTTPSANNISKSMKNKKEHYSKANFDRLKNM